jgi:hypothetical protein
VRELDPARRARPPGRQVNRAALPALGRRAAPWASATRADFSMTRPSARPQRSTR